MSASIESNMGLAGVSVYGTSMMPRSIPKRKRSPKLDSSIDRKDFKLKNNAES